MPRDLKMLVRVRFCSEDVRFRISVFFFCQEISIFFSLKNYSVHAGRSVVLKFLDFRQDKKEHFTIVLKFQRYF